MADTKTANYSKRTPLSDLSNKVSIPARASRRLLGSAHSAENSTDQKGSHTTIICNHSYLQDSVKAIPPLSGAVDTVISDGIGVKGESVKDPLNSMATDNPRSKRSQRARKSRVPLKTSRTKEKVTLAMHIRKYGSTQEIEY
jgi:hypothetical protein